MVTTDTFEFSYSQDCAARATPSILGGSYVIACVWQYGISMAPPLVIQMYQLDDFNNLDCLLVWIWHHSLVCRADPFWNIAMPRPTQLTSWYCILLHHIIACRWDVRYNISIPIVSYDSPKHGWAKSVRHCNHLWQAQGVPETNRITTWIILACSNPPKWEMRECIDPRSTSCLHVVSTSDSNVQCRNE